MRKIDDVHVIKGDAKCSCRAQPVKGPKVTEAEEKGAHKVFHPCAQSLLGSVVLVLQPRRAYMSAALFSANRSAFGEALMHAARRLSQGVNSHP